MSVIKLTHFAQEFRSMGGVESVLKHHLQADFGQGIESRFVVYQEDGAPPIERVSFLGLSQRSTIHQARLKLLEAVRQGPPEVAIHHTVWGMTYWADLDVARRRILLVHSDSPGLAESLRLREEWIDGVLCVSDIAGESIYRYRPRAEYVDAIFRLAQSYNEPIERDAIQRALREVASYARYRRSTLGGAAFEMQSM